MQHDAASGQFLVGYPVLLTVRLLGIFIGEHADVTPQTGQEGPVDRPIPQQLSECLETLMIAQRICHIETDMTALSESPQFTGFFKIPCHGDQLETVNPLFDRHAHRVEATMQVGDDDQRVELVLDDELAVVVVGIAPVAIRDTLEQPTVCVRHRLHPALGYAGQGL